MIFFAKEHFSFYLATSSRIRAWRSSRDVVGAGLRSPRDCSIVAFRYAPATKDCVAFRDIAHAGDRRNAMYSTPSFSAR